MTIRRDRVLACIVASFAMSLGVLPVTAKVRHQPLDLPDAPIPLGVPEPPFPVEAQWSEIEVNGKPAGGDPPSFKLDDKFRATGFSGCNTYSMPLYPVRGQKLAAGPIAMTHRQCDKDGMLLERNFLIVLHSLPHWSIEGSDLVLKSGLTTLRFRRGM